MVAKGTSTKYLLLILANVLNMLCDTTLDINGYFNKSGHKISH